MGKPSTSLRFAALIFAAGCGEAPTAPAAPVRIDLSQRWTRAGPAEVGMSATGLLGAAGDAAAIPRFRSLLVARHGRLVAEAYFGGADSTTLFDVRSVTKSVVGALTGIALRDGVLPGAAASIAPHLAPPDTLDSADSAVTVHDLVTMTSGYQWNEDTGDDYNQWISAGSASRSRTPPRCRCLNTPPPCSRRSASIPWRGNRSTAAP